MQYASCLMKKLNVKPSLYQKGIVFGTLYLPTIQNACSSEEGWEMQMFELYLPTIQNACSSAKGTDVITISLYLPTIQNACSSSDKYYSV